MMHHAAFELIEIPHTRQSGKNSADIRMVVDALDPEFGRAIAHHGVWEPHIIHVIRSLLQPGQTFVDVGANVGVMAFHAASVVGPGGRVIAFEPNPDNADVFQRGLLANGFQNVRLFTWAASDAYRLISLSRASNAKVRRGEAPLQYDSVVQADRLDTFLASQERVDLIKIDIEGYERPALEGLTETLARFRPHILCEFNPLCFGDLGYSLADMADYVFTLTDRVEVIAHSTVRTPIDSPAALIALWQQADAENASRGVLAPGWTHFDLLFRAGG